MAIRIFEYKHYAGLGDFTAGTCTCEDERVNGGSWSLRLHAAAVGMLDKPHPVCRSS